MKHDESLGRYISYLYRMGQCFLNKKLESYNIGSGQYAYLMVLFREDGISQECLSERIRMDKATTGRAIKKLINEGYVNRMRDPLDGRSYKIFLTDRGILLKPIIISAMQQWNNLLLQDMDEKEERFAVELLEKMSKNITRFK